MSWNMGRGCLSGGGGGGGKVVELRCEGVRVYICEG